MKTLNQQLTSALQNGQAQNAAALVVVLADTVIGAMVALMHSLCVARKWRVRRASGGWCD